MSPIIKDTKATILAARLSLEKLYFKLDDLEYDSVTAAEADQLLEIKNWISEASDNLREALSEFKD